MKLFQKHYLYYIVYELQDGTKAEKSAIELELRNPITSIAHCEAISEYILESLGFSQMEQKEPSKKKSARKTSRKKIKSQKAAPRALVLSFTLLRTQTRFFVK